MASQSQLFYDAGKRPKTKTNHTNNHFSRNNSDPANDPSTVNMSDNNGDQKRPHEDGDGAGDATKKAKADSGPPGTVLFSGATDFEDVGRSKGSAGVGRSPNTKWKPVKLAALEGVDVVHIASGCTAVHMFAVARDGRVWGWGRNEKGQLGLGHAKDRKCPTLLQGLEDKKIVSASCGRNHSLLLTGKNRNRNLNQTRQS